MHDDSREFVIPSSILLVSETHPSRRVEVKAPKEVSPLRERLALSKCTIQHSQFPARLETRTDLLKSSSRRAAAQMAPPRARKGHPREARADLSASSLLLIHTTHHLPLNRAILLLTRILLLFIHRPVLFLFISLSTPVKDRKVAAVAAQRIQRARSVDRQLPLQQQ